jgi:hypothetical protein
MSAVKKLPKGLPALPPIPPGWDAWELRGWGGLAREANETPWGCAIIDDCYTDWNVNTCDKSHGLTFLFYIEAVKHPKKSKPRRESLTARLATAIQTGRNNPSIETARDCMRLIENHQRAIRRKKNGK